MADTKVVRNADAPWEEFSSELYFADNYSTVLPEDREIIERVSDFFGRVFEQRDSVNLAIDVGSGPNLYPALLMLPWTRQILFTDYSTRNINWLQQHLTMNESDWVGAPFWEEIAHRPGYDHIAEPRKQLSLACSSDSGQVGIRRQNIFKLPKQRWELGTMFFVAESITEDFEEFRAAIRRFVGALVPGAPFAAAFMAESDGYKVAEERFPALKITMSDVEKCFLELEPSELSHYETQTLHKVRDGYTGMIVITGITRGR
ncbi:MAG TPA: SCO2525 family SAM-dependent methyltransferase [Streptosporangiaceae bacterium]|jgi:hypothetical protein